MRQTEEVVDLSFTAREVGQPVVCVGNESRAYGRIIELDGTPLDGQYPIITFCTPHGTSFKSGVIGLFITSGSRFVDPDDDDLEKLREFEAHAMAAGNWYNDRLPRPPMQACADSVHVDVCTDKEQS